MFTLTYLVPFMKESFVHFNGVVITAGASSLVMITFCFSSTTFSSFDFIYSFSVFTHLNEQAARQCLTTLSNYLDPGGVIVITIRPYEFWAQETHVSGILRTLEIDTYSLVARHQSGGFVFVPSGGIGQSTYGDSSFKAEWISKNLPQLKIVFLDYSLNDPSQLYVGLMKH